MGDGGWEKTASPINSDSIGKLFVPHRPSPNRHPLPVDSRSGNSYGMMTLAVESFRAARCSAILIRGTPLTIQSAGGAPVR